MACKPICRMCDKFVATDSITFAGGVVIINLPAGDYRNNTKYCIFLNQPIPTTATIGSEIVVTIGTGTEQYPLVKRNCRPATACNLRTRTKYSVCVETSATSGIFRLLGDPCCAPSNNLLFINGTAPTPTPASASVARSSGKSTTT